MRSAQIVGVAETGAPGLHGAVVEPGDHEQRQTDREQAAADHVVLHRLGERDTSARDVSAPITGSTVGVRKWRTSTLSLRSTSTEMFTRPNTASSSSAVVPPSAAIVSSAST